ncbi:MAG: winged helix-turn-helix transcriptional regulator [Chloroflexota bacterium]|nr:winged helix-turn-helix transcriptional regulator [Chloroflexota bacterium]MDE3193702.1 winged helix-turn-helix transcriptional regulator [Chloroflexota bacterium]
MADPQRGPIDAAAARAARAHLLVDGRETTARRLLDAVCDATRLNIVRALRAGPLPASDLAQILGRTASATSQHLRVLREVGAVVPVRSGNIVRYRLGTTATAVVLADVATAFDRVQAPSAPTSTG